MEGRTEMMREWTVQRRLRAAADAQRLYALCGARLYTIETLAGTFPDLGWHQLGEMGGVWAPPVKLLDGLKNGLPMSFAPDGRLAYTWSQRGLPAISTMPWI